MDTVTIKIYREAHNKLQIAHAKEIGKQKKSMSFQRFVDEVITAGLKDKGYKRFNQSRTGS